MRVPSPLFLLLLLCGCKDDGGDSGGLGDTAASFDPVTAADVQAVIDAGCSEESLATLAGADPAAVRQALVEADAELKLGSWSAGISHGHQVEVAYRTPLLQSFTFDYSLYVPEGYSANPSDPLPLYLNPGHPVDDLQDDITLPYQAGLPDQPVFFVQDNFYNRLYTDLGEDGYYEQVYHNQDFDHVLAYMDHELLIRAIFAELSRSYYIDRDQVYVGGVSAEGNAAWSHGIQSADLYAAILPVSAGTAGYHEDLWKNLENLGILVVHGTEDELCSVDDADERVALLEKYGFDVEYWREKGEGHGTMFWSEFGEMAAWLLERSRDLGPQRVHKAIQSDRGTDAYWLVGTEFSAELDPDDDVYPDQPPVLLDASWIDGLVQVETRGVTAFELRWIEGGAGPGSGSAGDDIEVLVDGQSLGSFTLAEDPTVAVEDYCVNGDIARAWAGRVSVDLP